MKKTSFYVLLWLIITMCFSLAIYNPVLAQETPPQSLAPNLQDAFGEESIVGQVGGNAGYQITSDQESEDKIFSLIGSIIRVIFSVLGIIFVILTILAGYRWMTAAGNEEQVSSAKKSLKQSIIGLVIIVLTWGAWVIIGRLASLF